MITSVQAQTLYAESVETVQKDDKDSLAMTMRQEMSLAVELLNHAANGNAAAWTDGASPLDAPSCRALGRSPTGPELEPFTPSPAKSHDVNIHANLYAFYAPCNHVRHVTPSRKCSDH